MRIEAPRLRKWLAVGAGIGIEIGEQDLTVMVTRVRPSGTRLLGAGVIARFKERPAAEWGAEYTDFVKRLGVSHIPATVLLPRQELIVRLLSLPGVSDRDLPSAIQYQLDSLHPFGEDEAAHAWCRIGRSGAVLVAIIRREILNRYIALFSEAGIKVAAFSFSAAAMHAAARMLSSPPQGGFLAVYEGDDGVEIYGESEARPVFSAVFDLPPERAAALAAAELRLPAETEPIDFAALLPRPVPADYDLSRSTRAYAAALAGACPLLALPLNLLPPQYRSSTSRAMYVPTAILVLLLAAALVALASITPIEDRKYLKALESEIARLEPLARKAGELDKEIEQVRTRAKLLDDYRRRAKADLDALAELNKLIPPPGWLTGLEMTRDAVVLNGQAEQAAPLLKAIDGSPLFQGSEFTVPITRSGTNEVFRIRAVREEPAQ
ncbi:MAG TPA: hypothetical protein PLA43_03695 [Bryobacteraceae bacterium]|nr:hypothetical protein [Bryobacteraceae bacterium]HOL72919.1 hypothetical protein [Bryobacteraceae bacterium]HOQ47094.1 hypothetical protein [Bryobacteraceae bacterium]HPQ13759.1 hypothetical protein [Bryobacteraceae bacterium]HPU71033.1 hypothetical protein [Bryobacteraceae bacterium]